MMISGGDLAQLRGGDCAGAQQTHGSAVAGDDGGFEADVTVPAIEHHPHRIAEFIAHVFGAGRAQATIAIGGGCGNATPRRRSTIAVPSDARAPGPPPCPGLRSRCRGHWRLAATPGSSGPARTARRAWMPWPASHIPNDARTWAIQVHDDRMIQRALFGLKNLAHCSRVLRIRTQPVDRFRRKRHKIAVAQCLHGSINFDLTGPDHLHHGGNSSKAMGYVRPLCATAL